MLELKNVTKCFGDFKALDNLSMTIPKGAVYGLVGPNGAGKSTAIRCLLGVYRPEHGEITLNGETIYENSEIKTTIGKWKVQNNPWSCDVTDIDKIPMEYHIKQEDKIDKAGLLKHFALTGEVIDGCEFVQKQGIRFR